MVANVGKRFRNSFNNSIYAIKLKIFKNWVERVNDVIAIFY